LQTAHARGSATGGSAADDAYAGLAPFTSGWHQPFIVKNAQYLD
jgi:hypothetical protein